MSSDHIPEGYIALFEASGRYIKARCEGGSPFDKYLEFFNGNQALPPPPDPVSLDEEQRIGVEVERWFVSVENEFAEPFRKGELTAIYRLRGSKRTRWCGLRIGTT